ncbi:MAG: polysaccharide export protein [Hyphomicrobiales bacterium]|nr:polysaccharide export protein [Rhodoblastus sp.]MCB9999427.1 polysaccharide export protein [Methylobacteriaceae bacterium]MCC2100124.1 polysaccharide export protein [Hyphomicrobiales bacterium]HRY02988.1 polysaccharide biosynthesis/export family protein [Beijerinckiaceae bacterium]MCB1522840.1 polysaccharide export protein [Rhodoblastus sp.]
MRRMAAALSVILATLASGCATRPYQGELAAVAEHPYAVGSGDRLRIIVFGQDSLSNSYSVDASGQISMPLIGLVPVNGMTTEQIQRAVESRLRSGFLREPRVSCEVEAYRPFFILGEVTNAGQYPYVNGMTVQTAVAIAGGYTPRAAQSWARMTRVIDGRQVIGDVDMTYPVQPGDTIQIRERFF